MSGHTPLPWAQGSVLPDVVVDGNGNTILFPPSAIRSTAEKEVNAEYVVRAVNSHEELLKAAQVALEYFMGDMRVDEGDVVPHLQAAIQKAGDAA